MTTQLTSSLAASSGSKETDTQGRRDLERQVLLEVLNALNVAPDLDALFAHIQAKLNRLFPADNCYVALYHHPSATFHFPFFENKYEAAPTSQRAGRSCAAYVFRTGRPLLATPEVFEKLEAQGEVERTGMPARAWLGVPLRRASQTIGVLVVQHYTDEHAYSQQDLAVLNSIGGAVALAIEHKRAEQNLRRQQRENEIIFDAAPLMILYKDAENRILRANRPAALALGTTSIELEGHSAYDLCPSEAVQYHQDDLEVIRTGMPKLGVIEPFQLSSGEIRTVSSDKIPYRDQTGKITGCVVFLTDITEKQRAEDALRRSEVNYRSVVHGAPYGICRASEDGQLFNVNPALVEMLGYESEEELLATNLDRKIFREPGERRALVKAHGELLKGVDAIWSRKDGAAIHVRLSGWPVRDPEWPSTCYELVAENVTEQRALERQLRQGQKMEAVGRLAGGIAHDFNNLLMVIKGHAELLLDQPFEADNIRSRSKVEQIEKAADRAAGLTRQLLAFSRMQVLQPKIIDLNDVVADIGKMLPRLIGEDVELAMDLKPRLNRIKADPGQIEQVIMNLAVNARDAMPNGGRIRIETGNVLLDEAFARRHPGLVAGPYVLLGVSDTGAGMDAETQAHIFEPFFTTKEVGKGTGLGLATVYGVVKQSGGYIAVESMPGKGATFRIYLPPVEQSAEPASSNAIPTTAPAGSGTILIAEDERAVRELAREFLSLSGYNVLEARDGNEAMEIAGSHAGQIDLLVTDVVMPRMGGRELAQRMREARPDTKILFMSGYAEFATHPENLDDKSLWLSKPFTRTALARMVGQILQSK